MTTFAAEQRLPASVLVIVAHPDDIEFGVGGSVAKWVANGAQVTYCIVTDGAAGSNDPNMIRENLIATRREEQLAAAKMLGVEDVRFLDYPDGILQPTLELRRDLTRVIRQVKPERVVCFDPTCRISPTEVYINHPDHVAAAEAALYAVFPSAESRPIFPELLAEGLEPHKVWELYMVLSDHHTTFVDVSEYLELKYDALLCHRSQLLDEKTVEMVSKWTSEAGKAVGVAHAEVFRVMNFRQDQPETA